jgi:hypothetical protein
MKYVRNESETHMNEVDGRERERKKKTHQSVAIVIAYVYYAFRQMFTQAKKDRLNNLSLLVLFLLPTFSLSLFFFLFRSCIYN